METIVITRTFDGGLDDMVEYARSLNSRLNWPGAVLEFERPGEQLGYTVGMRLKAATMTDVSLEETLSDVERSENGEVLFSTVNRGLWPDGHMTVLAEWRFIPGDEGDPNTLRYTYSYPPPSSKLVKPKQLPAFNEAMEKVCNRFIKGVLAHGGSAELAAATPVAPEPLSVAVPTGSHAVRGGHAADAPGGGVPGRGDGHRGRHRELLRRPRRDGRVHPIPEITPELAGSGPRERDGRRAHLPGRDADPGRGA